MARRPRGCRPPIARHPSTEVPLWKGSARTDRGDRDRDVDKGEARALLSGAVGSIRHCQIRPLILLVRFFWKTRFLTAGPRGSAMSLFQPSLYNQVEPWLVHPLTRHAHRSASSAMNSVLARGGKSVLAPAARGQQHRGNGSVARAAGALRTAVAGGRRAASPTPQAAGYHRAGQQLARSSGGAVGGRELHNSAAKVKEPEEVRAQPLGY